MAPTHALDYNNPMGWSVRLSLLLYSYSSYKHNTSTLELGMGSLSHKTDLLIMSLYRHLHFCMPDSPMYAMGERFWRRIFSWHIIRRSAKAQTHFLENAYSIL